MILCTLYQVIHHMNSSEIFSVESLPVLMNSSYIDLHGKKLHSWKKKLKNALTKYLTTKCHRVVDILSKVLKSKVFYLLGHAHSPLIVLTLELLRVSFESLDTLHQRRTHNFL